MCYDTLAKFRYMRKIWLRVSTNHLNVCLPCCDSVGIFYAVEARYMHYLYVDEVIAKMEKVVEEKDKGIKEKDKELEEKSKMLKEVEGKVKEVEGKVKEAEGKVKEAEGRVKEAEGKVKEAKDAIVEMVFETIEELGEISGIVRERIRNEQEIDILKSIYKAAIKADSVKQFEEKIANL